MEAIRSAIAQASSYLTEHPEAATSTDAAATAVLEDGLRFRVDGPTGSLTTDMSKSVGGGASGPTPAWLMRAALAACDATLVAMEAARDGIELTDLEVNVESESDFRGVLGVDPSVQPGPLSMRVGIRVAAANASDEQLRAIVERAEARSPVRHALAQELPMTTEIQIDSASTAVA
jgi:uncharacterized OsmC-like protein